MNLGENIKRRRENLKLSQEYVAEQLGVSRQAVSKWETSQSEPTVNNLIRLAEVFEISLSELVDPQNNDKKHKTPERERHSEKPNLILRKNLTSLAIALQAGFLYAYTSAVYMLRSHPNDTFYRGQLIFSLALLLLASIWMTTNHRYEPDKGQRKKNVNIELGYCTVQALAGLLTIRFGMGLVGLALILLVMIVYILYINPKFMSRKLTK